MTPREADHRVELEELLVRPGTYFNPQTEVVVVVDDSVSIDQEVFNMEAYEGADWIRVSDDVPIDEDARDEALERFQTDYHPASARTLTAVALEGGDEEEDELTLDPDEDAPEPGDAA